MSATDDAAHLGDMNTSVITDFYAAKKALHDARIFNGAPDVLAALGYVAPERTRVDGRVVKVYRTDGSHLLKGDEVRSYRGSRSVYSPDLPVNVAATSKKDAAVRVGVPEHLVNATVRLTQEIDPSDLRYPVAVANSNKAVFTVKGDEFGEVLLVELPEG